MQNLCKKPTRNNTIALAKTMMTGAVFIIFTPLQAYAQDGVYTNKNAGIADTEDVVFMLADSDDFLARLELDNPAEEIMSDVVNTAATNVRLLANAGMKTIILSEMQPLQSAPQYQDAPEVQAALTDLVRDVNVAMLAAVKAENLPSDVHVMTVKYEDMVSYMNQNTALDGRIQSATRFDHQFETSLGAKLNMSEQLALSVRYARNWTSDIHEGVEGAITMRVNF